ncbi:MAG TPA: 23S rRNA pseudouridine(1911/1915/1917) synthase RluD [Rhodocyclaceae bacterium]|nr:23S rRNA pseudouridine(1911/1915/1917) synthase RluD [Rhodocyclaceae bacterium]
MKLSEKDRGDYSASSYTDLCVPDHGAGARLDQVLAGLLSQHSRNRLQGWIKEGRVRVDGQVETEPKKKMLGGERLVVDLAPDPETIAELPEDIPLQVIFEDDSLLVIDKPAGLVVHPGSGNWSGTLMNALLHHVPGIEAVPRAGIVHRLDKETSGLLVVAKTLEAQTDLVRQLQARTVKRQYLALASGVITQAGTIDEPISRHPAQRTKMAVVAGGKPAVTHFRVLERFAKATLLECSLETGRTHQIRVHLAHAGHFLIGDPVYGRAARNLPLFPRQALHATRLGLKHPGTGEAMQWEVPMPADMQGLLELLRAA